MTGKYQLDQHGWAREPERLRALENACDPQTTAVLNRLGVGPGWRCLEVGAGAGSIAAWLADTVTPGGAVHAVDLDTTLLDQLA